MSIVNTKNAARLSKFGMDSAITTALLASAVIAIGIATKTIAISYLPASLGFLGALATPLGITILLGLTAYFALSAFTSFQQLQENQALKANIDCVSKNCSKDGFIDLSTVVAPWLQSGEIIEKDDNGKKSLHLKLTAEVYKALVGNTEVGHNVTSYAIVAGNKAVPLTFRHAAPPEVSIKTDGDEGKGTTEGKAADKVTDHRTVQLISVNSEEINDANKLSNAKKALGMNESGELKVSISKENLDKLKEAVGTSFAEQVISHVVDAKRI